MKNFPNNVCFGNMNIGYLSIPCGNQNRRVILLEPGFSVPAQMRGDSPLHKHEMTEIHILTRGSKTIQVGNQAYPMRMGDLLAIPPSQYHEGTDHSTDMTQVIFELELTLTNPKQLRVPLPLLTLFLEELKMVEITKDYRKLRLYLALFCEDLMQNEASVDSKVDYAYRIRYFFDSHYYKDVYLSDLAHLLHVSEKQAERLVVKHTGNKFRKELTLHRIRVAKRLVEQGEMPLTEIAEYVGYKSYSGFWKAWKRYNGEPRN